MKIFIILQLAADLFIVSALLRHEMGFKVIYLGLDKLCKELEKKINKDKEK